MERAKEVMKEFGDGSKMLRLLPGSEESAVSLQEIEWDVRGQK